MWQEQDGRCFWCAERRATRNDPLVPAGWFAAPPTAPITVPSCNRCSSSNGDGSDQQPPLLIQRQRTSTNGELPGDPSTRTLSRKQARGLPDNAVASLRAVAEELATHRFERVLRNIVRGLYYHHFGERLDSEVPVRVLALQGSRADRHPLWDSAGGRGALGTAVRYSFGRFARKRSASIWLIDLYGGASFVGLTDLEELARATGVVTGSSEPLAS